MMYNITYMTQTILYVKPHLKTATKILIKEDIIYLN